MGAISRNSEASAQRCYRCIAIRGTHHCFLPWAQTAIGSGSMRNEQHFKDCKIGTFMMYPKWRSCLSKLFPKLHFRYLKRAAHQHEERQHRRQAHGDTLPNARRGVQALILFDEDDCVACAHMRVGSPELSPLCTITDDSHSDMFVAALHHPSPSLQRPAPYPGCASMHPP